MRFDQSSSPKIIGFVLAASLTAGANNAIEPVAFAYKFEQKPKAAASDLPIIHLPSALPAESIAPDYSSITALAARHFDAFSYPNEFKFTEAEKAFLSGEYLRDYDGE